MRQLSALIVTLVLLLSCGGSAQAYLQSPNSSGRFYTKEQAERGTGQYKQYCSHCHGADLSGMGNTPALVGRDFLRRWYSVGDLFAITSMAMPADRVLGLTTDEYLNVLAYIFEANDFPAGSEPLRDDVNAMHAMVLTRTSGQPDQSRTGVPAAKAAPDAFYTEEQAERGKAYFTGACRMCHSIDPDHATQLDPPNVRGYRLGSIRKTTSLAYGSIPEKYRSVGDLFLKIRTTMPGYDGGGLSEKEYVDIVAYLLRANGLPAGPKELTGDISAMKTMALVEKGFDRLFNGKDFSGFGFVLGTGCALRPSGCGQTEPGTTFQVEDGTIVSSGKPLGYMYTEKAYLNFTLRFEYRFEPHQWMETDDDFYGNSGYLLFITNHRVWPKSIEIQGRNAAVLSVIPEDTEAKFSVDDEARKRALKPVGQWNAVEIVSRGGQVRSYLNGTLISTVSQHEFKEPGYIGFQSEGAKIQWRYIRIKAE